MSTTASTQSGSKRSSYVANRGDDSRKPRSVRSLPRQRGYLTLASGGRKAYISPRDGYERS